MSPDTLGPLLPAIPAGLGLVGLLVPRANRTVAAALGVTGAAAALAIVVALLADGSGRGQGFQTSREWVTLGDLPVTLGVAIDQRALFVALAVAVVALAVQVYSIGYLADDGRYGPYAAQISIFTAAMLAVVVGGDLILVLIGWEVMGACSYLLI